MKPVLGITMGDFNGIGPEITLKALLSPQVLEICQPILIGSIDVYEHYAGLLKIRINLSETEKIPSKFTRGAVPVLNYEKFRKPVITPGKPSTEGGKYAGEALEMAVRLCKGNGIQGMVTSPVSKERMIYAGYHYPGQTEMLAKLSGARHAAMMLIAGRMRVGLATVHMPLRLVPFKISADLILEKISTINGSLKKDFSIKSPAIAVLALNPHSGEGGLLGNEEKTIISPALEAARRRRIRVEGPFPADGFFGNENFTRYDAILAMYHDQGLIPLKMKGFSVGVNFSAGLSFVRTSPDHGTAYDIAGKGTANPRSMIEAVKLAVHILNNRNKSSR